MAVVVVETTSESAPDLELIVRSRRSLGAPFWRFWTAATVSNLGDGFALVAFPLMAARMTESAGLVAGAVFAQRLPWLLFGLPAGALADRLNRGRAMAVVDF